MSDIPKLEARRFANVWDYPDNPIPKTVDGKINPEWEKATLQETIRWMNISDNITTK